MIRFSGQEEKYKVLFNRFLICLYIWLRLTLDFSGTTTSVYGVLGVEPRALHMLGKQLNYMPSPRLFAEMGSCCVDHAGLYPPASASWESRITGGMHAYLPFRLKQLGREPPVDLGRTQQE